MEFSSPQPYEMRYYNRPKPDRPMISIPKPRKIKSPKIRKSAKGQMCTLRLPGICSGNRDEVMLCHINSNYKGTGNKSHDIHSYYGCYNCHVNERKASAEDLLRALIETQHIMIQEGLIKV